MRDEAFELAALGPGFSVSDVERSHEPAEHIVKPCAVDLSLLEHVGKIVWTHRSDRRDEFKRMIFEGGRNPRGYSTFSEQSYVAMVGHGRFLQRHERIDEVIGHG